MKVQALLSQGLNEMAILPGVEGCALVEIETGMVWYNAGKMTDMQPIAEASSDYWRLYTRLDNHFARLGEMRAAAFMHAQGSLTLLPCGRGILLVALTREKSTVNWAQWQSKTKELANLVNFFITSAP